MDTTPGIIESIIEKVKAYLVTSLELTKLKLIQSVTTLLSGLVVKLLLFVLITILAIIFSIAAGLWIGEILGKTYYDFFAVSGFYLVLILMVNLFLLKWIKRNISRSILKHLL